MRLAALSLCVVCCAPVGYRVEPGLHAALGGDWRPEHDPNFVTRMRSRVHNGELWIQIVELDEEYLEMSPGVLARNIVENLAGGRWWVRLDGRRVRGRHVRWASTLVEETTAVIQGQPAHVVLVDVANVDQLQMDPNARFARAALAVIRGGVYRIERRGNVQRKWPMLMIVGYANAPEEFEASYDDFARLLDHLRFGDSS